MNVDSVSTTGSTFTDASAQAVQQARHQEATETRKAGQENDGNSAEKSASIVSSAPSPSVNTSGQKVGQVINVTA